MRVWLKKLMLATAVSVCAVGCSSFLLPDDPEVSEFAVFDALWDDFDRHYSLFISKGANWDSLRTAYRSRIYTDMTNEDLFDVLASMLEELRDGHVLLVSSFDTRQYQRWNTDYPVNYDIELVMNEYLPGRYVISGHKMILHALIEPGIGYICIPTFTSQGWTGDIDGILDSLAGVGARSIIIDVRSNGGGSDGNSIEIAGRFADTRRPYRQYVYRNGPEHTDFTDPVTSYLTPKGPEQFTGRIAVLTNRGVFSAAESFVLAMQQLPYVTVIGDTTGGGSGSPISRELPNGWSYRMPVWVETTPEGIVYDSRGLYPDIPVWITKEDSLRKRDTILDKAVKELRTAQN